MDMDKYYVEVGDYAELKDGSKYFVDYFGRMKLKDGRYQYYIILCDNKNVFKLNRKPSEFIYSYDLKDDFNKIGKYDFTKESEMETLNIINELDEIVMKCRTKVKEKDLFLQRTQYDKYDYMYEGYRLAMNDAIDLVRELNKKVKLETPPCTGSSVQKQTKIDRLELKTHHIIGHDFIQCGSGKKFVMSVKNGCDYTETTPPTNEQLMNKINEIIDVINKER